MDWSEPLDYQYLKAANPEMPAVPIKTFSGELHRVGATRVIHFDHARDLKTDYPATSPNCLASYVRICAGESITTDIEATSHLFYILRGEGRTDTSSGAVPWRKDDLITLPACERITHTATGDTAMYWVNDSPLLRYLGAKPVRPTFHPVHYTAEWLTQETRKAADDPDAASSNRIGILLANPSCPLTRTVTPTLWSLLEIVPAGAVLPPHRHNSVALDLAIRGCGRGYTLMGRELDDENHIKDSVRVDWMDASAFTTPPMLWHEHHNEGDEEVWLLPIQDAGLVTYDRILDIRFAAGGPPRNTGVTAF